jgi:hypothetical protein
VLTLVVAVALAGADAGAGGGRTVAECTALRRAHPLTKIACLRDTCDARAVDELLTLARALERHRAAFPLTVDRDLGAAYQAAGVVAARTSEAALLKMAEDPQADGFAHRFALEALAGAAGAPGVSSERRQAVGATCARSLEHVGSDRELEKAALRCLGHSNDRGALTALVARAVASPSWEVKRAAVAGIAALGPKADDRDRLAPLTKVLEAPVPTPAEPDETAVRGEICQLLEAPLGGAAKAAAKRAAALIGNRSQGARQACERLGGR